MIVICRKWPISAIRDHEKLRNCKVFLEIVICRKWPLSAIPDLVHDLVFCDRDRELQGPDVINIFYFLNKFSCPFH